MGSIPLRFKTVSLWCAPCDRFVEIEGPVYDSRIDAPVHITPAAWVAHRSSAHHTQQADRRKPVAS